MKRPRKSAPKTPPETTEPLELRIIGGHLRGRKLLYSGETRTRPMKERVREAVFNLLGPSVAGKHAIDLFAGTGALGLEAISRGAAQATLVEQHFPTAAIIRRNAEQLGIADRCQIVGANAFIWIKQQAPAADPPWVVFCSPPYAFYRDRRDDMLALVEGTLARAPSGSTFVAESDQEFPLDLLPNFDQWDVRIYPPAVIALLRT